MRATKEQLIAKFREAEARGISIQQLEAEELRQPPATGLLSDFGYERASDTGRKTVNSWDPDEDHRLAVKARRRIYEYKRQAIIRGASRAESVSRRAIIARDESKCYLCGKLCEESEIHLDHVVPLSRGGEHSARNIRVACAPCNLSKGVKLLAA